MSIREEGSYCGCFPIESPQMQEAHCSSARAASNRIWRGAGRCTFMPMTSQRTFRQRHAAARKSYYAMDARYLTFQFRQRAIVQRFQI